MEFIKINNFKIAYQCEGKGNTLVFIHGFLEDSTMWAEFIQPFTSNHQVVTIDLPGFGQSDRWEESGIEQYAYAVKAVLEHLHIEQCTMIGHSMGGYVTLAFAEAFPTLLNAFCLFHSHAFADSTQRKEKRLKGQAFIQKYGLAAYAKGLIPMLFPSNFVKRNTPIINRLTQQAATFEDDGVIDGLMAMKNRPNRMNVLTESTVPVLFIIGKEDISVHYKESLKMISLPTVSQVHLLANVGHMGMFEAPQLTQNILHSFLEFKDNYTTNC